MDMLSEQSVTVRKLAQLIGKLTATNQAILAAPLHYRNLQSLKTKGLHAGGHYDYQVSLDQDSLSEIRWWIYQLELWNGKTLLKTSPYTILQSDASLVGWGAVCQKSRIGGLWTQEEKSLHINWLELKAITLAVQSFLKDSLSKHVLVQMNNKTAVAYVNKMGELFQKFFQTKPPFFGIGA